MCELECGVSSDSLQFCAGCNVAYHGNCHIEVFDRPFYFGLDEKRQEIPWCKECYDDWIAVGKAAENVETKEPRRADYDPESRHRAESPGALPPTRKKEGRKRVRTVRSLRPLLGHLNMCALGRTCANECNRVSTSLREELRAEFDKRRKSLEKGARRRSMEFLFNFVRRETDYPTHKPPHPDASGGRQKCRHCRFDPAYMWSPQTSHTLQNCRRRNEPRNGHTYVYKYFLYDEGGAVEVCAPFWRDTFCVSQKTQLKLARFSSGFQLPPGAFTWGGSTKSNREVIVLEYMASVPRHFSHFSMCSTHEYVDCASSALNWWRGPTEVNDDGTISPCFLEFYKSHGWWPGVNVENCDKPAVLCGPNAIRVPQPAVSYRYFLGIVNRFQFRFKDLSADQCSTCIRMRSEIQVATPMMRPELAAAWLLHKRQADKGYVHRQRLIECSKKEWEDMQLPPPTDSTFPPRPRVLALSHPGKTDFTECDMGGGRRTPWVKAGPQYFLRTMVSKPFYICSSVNGSVAYWWNEMVGEWGAQNIVSLNYMYDTTHGTGSGRRELWVDGTAAQSYNRDMFRYLVDATNPESPTFNDDAETPHYMTANM